MPGPFFRISQKYAMCGENKAGWPLPPSSCASRPAMPAPDTVPQCSLRHSRETRRPIAESRSQSPDACYVQVRNGLPRCQSTKSARSRYSPLSATNVHQRRRLLVRKTRQIAENSANDSHEPEEALMVVMIDAFRRHVPSLSSGILLTATATASDPARHHQCRNTGGTTGFSAPANVQAANGCRFHRSMKVSTCVEDPVVSKDATRNMVYRR